MGSHNGETGSDVAAIAQARLFVAELEDAASCAAPAVPVWGNASRRRGV